MVLAVVIALGTWLLAAVDRLVVRRGKRR